MSEQEANISCDTSHSNTKKEKVDNGRQIFRVIHLIQYINTRTPTKLSANYLFVLTCRSAFVGRE